jgi:hypothetical protein
MSVKQKVSERVLRQIGPNSTGDFDVKIGRWWRRQCGRCLCLISPNRDRCECFAKEDE